jgi:hypothetical protein
MWGLGGVWGRDAGRCRLVGQAFSTLQDPSRERFPPRMYKPPKPRENLKSFGKNQIRRNQKIRELIKDQQASISITGVFESRVR